jgi:hypothetical protein
MALEPNSLYVQATKGKIFLLPYLPCAVLEEPFIMALLEQTKDLSEWSALFTRIINDLEDHGAKHALSGETFERWQERVRLLLRTSRSPLAREQSPLTIDGSIREPSTPDVDLDFKMEEEGEEEWKKQGTPESLIEDLRRLRVGLEKVSSTTLMMHREFAGVSALHSGDLRTLDCRVQALDGTVGSPCHVPGVEAQTLWNIVSELGAMTDGRDGNPPSLIAQTIELQQRVGSLQGL